MLILMVGSKLAGCLHELFESCVRSLNSCMNPPVKEEAMVADSSNLRSAHMDEHVAECGELRRAPLLMNCATGPSTSSMMEEGDSRVRRRESNAPSGIAHRVKEPQQPLIPVSRYFTDPTTRKKYYAVIRGFVPGIYESWEDCEPQVRGYSGQVYKSFKTRVEAEQYLQSGLRKAEEHALQGHQYKHVGLDDSGEEIYRCEYCLEMYRNLTHSE